MLLLLFVLFNNRDTVRQYITVGQFPLNLVLLCLFSHLLVFAY